MASKAALAPLVASPNVTLEHVAFKTRKALAEQTPTNLFRAPANIIRSWKGRMSGAHEWQTSTYCYNKNTQKTMPVASRVADKLLRDYMTMIRGTGTESTGSSSTARNAVALRRKDTDKMYVSETSMKDFGDKIVINAFVYDGVHAAEEERQARQAARQAAAAARKPRAAGARGPAGARRPPMGARRPLSAPRLPMRPGAPSRPGGPRLSPSGAARAGAPRPQYIARPGASGSSDAAQSSGAPRPYTFRSLNLSKPTTQPSQTAQSSTPRSSG